jgi:NACHT domain
MEVNRTRSLDDMKTEILKAIQEQHRNGDCSSQDQLTVISTKLLGLAYESSKENVEHKILDSLRFGSMSMRHSKIPEAHAKTFGWIFEDSTHDSCPPTRFGDWLRTRNDLYWVSGKAGSGKSTLMKYLCNHTRTKEALQTWAGGKKLVVASFFFWVAGSDMQKSQEGLLQSLLFEILRQCPSLIKVVCSSKWPGNSSYTPSGQWLRSELLEAFRQLVVNCVDELKFCFFIDGLDEYDGNHIEIIEVLKGLLSSPNIKICVSSRPWNVFEDAFGQDKDRRLYLEELTRCDIQLYVRNKLEKNRHFVRLKESDPACQNVVDEIVTKARGVFLWVFLVTRSLIQGLTDADTVSDLEKRLQAFPPELEPYFRHMLDSVEDMYKAEMARLFLVALQGGPHSLTVYASIMGDNLDWVVGFHEETKYGSPKIGHGDSSEPGYNRSKTRYPKTISLGSLDIHESVLIGLDQTRRRINARSKDLLEVSNQWATDIDINSMHPQFYVDFLHRTVRDFLLARDVQDSLISYIEPDFKAEVPICQAYLNHLNVLVCATGDSCCDVKAYLAIRFAEVARQIEVRSRESPYDLIEEFKHVVSAADGFFWAEVGANSFRHFIMTSGLFLYASRCVSTWDGAYDDECKATLLDHVLQTNPPSRHGSYSTLELVRMLLKNDAKPDGLVIFDKSPYMSKVIPAAMPTPWARFLYHMYKTRDSVSSTALEIWLEIAELLLIYGANVTHQPFLSPSMHVSEILHTIFAPEGAARLDPFLSSGTWGIARLKQLTGRAYRWLGWS